MTTETPWHRKGTAANVRHMAMHENQLRVTVDVVRRLVSDQFPEWALLPITPIHMEGTVNAIFRIGGGLAARFPRQPGEFEATRQWLRSEADAALELLDHTSFAVPEPVAIGEPGAGYPLPWSVQTWLHGTTASQQDPSNSSDFAHDLANFIEQVRAIDVRGRSFAGNGRGGDLWSHDEWMEVCFEQSEQLFDVSWLRRIWARLRELPRESPYVMTHGDLIPGNVLVDSGRLAGILDVGGLGPADPALDLVSAWHLLDTGPRKLLREGLRCDELEWERGKAWAFEQAMGAVWYYRLSNPPMSRMGRRTLERILADEGVS
jgi:aminoglycoside phosphotransferase (APT) family kinase protein